MPQYDTDSYRGDRSITSYTSRGWGRDNDWGGHRDRHWGHGYNHGWYGHHGHFGYWNPYHYYHHW